MNEPLYTYEKFKRKIIFYNDRMIVHKGVVKEIHYEDIIKINRKGEHFISLQLPDKKRSYRLPIRSDDDEAFNLLIKFLESYGREFVEIQGERELKAPTSDFFNFKPTRQFYIPLVFGLLITFLSLLQNCYFIWFGITVLIGAVLSMFFNVRSIMLGKLTVIIEGFLFRYEVPYESIKYFKDKGFYCIDSKTFLASNVRYDENVSLKQSLFQYGALQGNEELSFKNNITGIIKAGLSAAFGIGTFFALVASIVPFILLVGGLFFDADPELWKVDRAISSGHNNYFIYSNEIDRALRKVEDLHLTKKERKLLENYINRFDEAIPEGALKLYQQNKKHLSETSNLENCHFLTVDGPFNGEEYDLFAVTQIALLNLVDAKVSVKSNEAKLCKRIKQNLKLAIFLSYQTTTSQIVANNIAAQSLKFVRNLSEKVPLEYTTLIKLQNIIADFNQNKATLKHEFKQTSHFISKVTAEEIYKELEIESKIAKWIAFNSINLPKKGDFLFYCMNLERFIEPPFSKEKLSNLRRYRSKYFKRLAIHPNSFNGFVMGFAIDEMYLILQDYFYYQPIFDCTPLQLAISQFKHEKQRLPKALNELIPKYIEKIPRDLLTNYSTKIKYEVFDDGSWQLSNDKSLLKDFIVGFSTDETSVFVEKELSRYEIHKLKQ